MIAISALGRHSQPAEEPLPTDYRIRGGRTMLGTTMVVATLPVSDLERARVFYGETLGLTPLWENPASIRFPAGEVSQLSALRRPGRVTQHTLSHFEVADSEATVRDLEPQ